MNTFTEFLQMVVNIWFGWLLVDVIKDRIRKRKTKKIIRNVDEAMSKWLSEHYPSQPAQKYVPPPDPGLPEKTVKPTNRR